MAIYMWRDVPDYLCFTAEQANSTIQLHKWGTPTVVNIETSTDWSTRTDYTFDTVVTLSSIWDKIYFRNKSESDTSFSTSSSNYYQFIISNWVIGASWDVTFLLNKNWTTTLHGNYCFYSLFNGANSLTTAPSLPATTLTSCCYSSMFSWCTILSTLTELPATTLSNYCYENMFYNCYQIKLSITQTWVYQTPYRIPMTWTWTAGTNSLRNMFYGGDISTPTINTTYYTSNTVI